MDGRNRYLAETRQKCDGRGGVQAPPSGSGGVVTPASPPEEWSPPPPFTPRRCSQPPHRSLTALRAEVVNEQRRRGPPGDHRKPGTEPRNPD